MYKKKVTPLLFLCPSLCGMAIFVLIPYLDILFRSFISHNSFSLKNYWDIFNNDAFKLAIGNTGKFILTCIPLLLVLSLLLALFINKTGKAGKTICVGLLLPMAFPVSSFVVVWKAFFDNQGFVNKVLSMMNLTSIDWMESKYAFGVLVACYIWRNVGYSIVLWIAGLRGISIDIYEAAKMDGANERVCFWKITMPNLIQILFTTTIISVLNSFKVFREAYLVAGDYPDQSIYMIQHLLNNWFRDLALNKIAAASVINTVVMILIVLLLKRSWKVDG